MKKFIISLLISILFFQNFSLANEIKTELYYKRQIENQRYRYNLSGFYKSVKKKNYIVIEAFLDAGFNPDSKHYGTPLIFYTIKEHDKKALDIFLTHSADLNIASKNKNLLMCCIDSSNSAAVQILINHNIDVNQKFKAMTPLNYAIKKDQSKITEMLLMAGAKPDEQTYELVNKSKDEYLKSLFE